MTDSDLVDSTDHAILGLQVQDGRRTVTEIAERISLSPSAVKRRWLVAPGWGI